MEGVALVLCGALVPLGVTGSQVPGEAAPSRVRLSVRGAAGAGLVEVLLPDSVGARERLPVVYVLPVEPDTQRQYGAPLDEISRLGLQNRYRFIAVFPTFKQTPWFADHPTDSSAWQERYLVRAVVPAVDSAFATVARREGRLLVGFSKSGFGAVALAFRNPELFGAAASWDAPLMMTRPGPWGSDPVFGTQENFDRHTLMFLLARPDGAKRPPRIVVLGGGEFFDRHAVRAHEMLVERGIAHIYVPGVAGAHSWTGGWLPEAIRLLFER